MCQFNARCQQAIRKERLEVLSVPVAENNTAGVPLCAAVSPEGRLRAAKCRIRIERWRRSGKEWMTVGGGGGVGGRVAQNVEPEPAS